MIIGGHAFEPEKAPHIMGVVNLSPESPNQDSIAADAEAALERARRLTAGGAGLIELGAQSSHFAAPLLPVEEEIARLLPALQVLKSHGYVVAVDTFRAEVASAVLDAGADLLNDSDGFQDPRMIDVLARWGGPVIIPFVSGPTPHDPVPFDYEEPMADILPFLTSAVQRADALGLNRILLDPGTGYRYPGVSPEEKERYQVKVYEELSRLRSLGYPLLVALPRKENLARTLALAQTILATADFVRAHDPAIVRAALQAGLRKVRPADAE